MHHAAGVSQRAGLEQIFSADYALNTVRIIYHYQSVDVMIMHPFYTSAPAQIGFAAVSYTHLDVYKRQPYGIAYINGIVI